jgi:hypothetical protein
VGFTFTNGTEVLGHDMGVVAFHDGWMSFEGEACQFSVRAADVSHFTVDHPMLRPPQDEVTIDPANGCSFAYGDYRASMRPFAPADGAEAALGNALPYAFREWTVAKVPDGDSVFPPTHRRPLATRLTTPTYWIAGGYLLLTLVASFAGTLLRNGSLVDLLAAVVGVAFVFLIAYLPLRKKPSP